jgi:hypothetical protein
MRAENDRLRRQIRVQSKKKNTMTKRERLQLENNKGAFTFGK